MRTRLIVAVLACVLCFARSAAAQEIKPASQADIAQLQEQIKALQEQIAQLKTQTTNQQSQINTLNAQLTATSQRLDTVHNDDAAFFALLTQWKTALETWKGSHFIIGVARDSNGTLKTACCMGLTF